MVSALGSRVGWTSARKERTNKRTTLDVERERCDVVLDRVWLTCAADDADADKRPAGCRERRL